MQNNEIPRIIEATNYLGGKLVDWLESLVQLVQIAGYANTVSLLIIVSIIAVIFMVISMFVMFTKRLKGLTEALTILTDKVSSPYLDVNRSVELFRIVMENHISKKMKFIKSVLENNSLETRRKQIEHNLENEFRRITTNEAEKLSRYHSVCGDIGKTLEKTIEWGKFLSTIYQIFFSEFTHEQKMTDIEAYMNRSVDGIAKIIEESGLHNC